MPYEIIWEDKGVLQRHWGLVHPQELLDFDQEFTGDMRSDSCKYILADFSEVTDHTIEDKDVYITAGFDIGSSKSIPNVKVALVATRERVRASCEAYRKIMLVSNTDWQVELFEDVKSARAWIG